MIISINAEKALGKVNTCFDKNSQQTRSIYRNQLYFYVQATKYQKIKNLKYTTVVLQIKYQEKNLTKNTQNVYKQKYMLLREIKDLFQKRRYVPYLWTGIVNKETWQVSPKLT